MPLRLITLHAAGLSGLGKKLLCMRLAASATGRRSSTGRPGSCVAYPARQRLPPCPAAAPQPAASVQSTLQVVPPGTIITESLANSAALGQVGGCWCTNSAMRRLHCSSRTLKRDAAVHVPQIELCKVMCTSEAVGRKAGTPCRHAVTRAASCGGQLAGSRRRSPAATLQHHVRSSTTTDVMRWVTELRTLLWAASVQAAGRLVDRCSTATHLMYTGGLYGPSKHAAKSCSPQYSR